MAHCSNITCGAAQVTTLDLPTAETQDVGQYSSITIGGDGLGLMSYYDFSNQDLKLARCSNLLCVPYFRRR